MSPPSTRRYLLTALVCSLAWYGVLLLHPLTRALMWGRAAHASLQDWLVRASGFVGVVVAGLALATALRRQLRAPGLFQAFLNALKILVVGPAACCLLRGGLLLALRPDPVSWTDLLDLIPTLMVGTYLIPLAWWYMLPLGVLTAVVLRASQDPERPVPLSAGGAARPA